jgi:indolepyruvate ferredoxin oxidoreductase beta subunit
VSATKPINIAILAMGGEGGGVLTDWLVQIGEQAGYLAQKTSVPGVAQRTGATIYYVELFPRDGVSRPPVLGLMPMPGDIDLLVASELMEAGRAIQRGLVTPDRTHLVASTHRVYAMTEKIALSDGRVDADAIVKACKTAALDFVGFDMQRIAEEHRSVISAVLLGAIAGAKALPFARSDYEQAIRHSGRSADRSLAAFAAGYAATERDGTTGEDALATHQNSVPSRAGIAIDDAVTGEARSIVVAGIERAVDYQDGRYARDYYQRLAPFIALAKTSGEAGLTLLSETARQLALGMTYEDTIRVAELKIRRSRFERVRAEVGVDAGQILEIVEFMHPRIEEVADTLPAGIGRWVLRNSVARRVLTRLTARGRKVHTTSLRGFLLLYGLASMKGMRRGTLRFQREMSFLAEWMDTVRSAATVDLPLAAGFAELRNLVKGYGETYERGFQKYHKICAFTLNEVGHPDAVHRLRALMAAAERDEFGEALDLEIRNLEIRKLSSAH